ncbi:hypothetical protein B0H13DRAFT_2240545 [Mycena leptocephala]|nr:hypothetical protein B0H13DRAFT_2240545 [Mycena leptocephala]
MTIRKAYSGARALVLGIDVGTTYSAVSILEPGQVPVIRAITRFPGQQDVDGDSKVPPLSTMTRRALSERWGRRQCLKNRWNKLTTKVGNAQSGMFKLHLRPTVDGPEIPPLPHRETATSVLADFLRYLFECAKTFIEETHANGRALWLSLQHNVQFVMAHPNGWEGKPQSQMCDAAVIAGLIPTPMQDANDFANLHFASRTGLLRRPLMLSGNDVVVVHAGGGPIDLSTYRLVKKSNGHKKYQEIAPPQCLFQGSIYVTQRARDYLEAHLEHSKYAGDVEYMAHLFDISTKLRFSGEEFSYIKFGTHRDEENASLNIRNGQLKIPGSDVKQFFEPSISAIVDAIREQCISAIGLTSVSAVFLVGGFASNNWLFSELKSRLQSLRLDLIRPIPICSSPSIWLSIRFIKG